MIKKIKIELIIIALLLGHIFILGNTNIGIYNLFYEHFGSVDNIYLKKFFINITEIGDSLWFFILSILGFLTSYFLLKSKIKSKIIQNLKNFFLFLFTSTLLTGFLTQLIKHLNNEGFKVYFCSAYSRNIYEVRNKCMLGSPTKGTNQLPFDGRQYDYVLWIDSDIVFTNADFDLLYKEDMDVISGLYIMANDKDFAAVETWDEDHFQNHGTFEFLAKENVRSRYMPFKVEYVGFGFILFKQGIFEQLQYPWFEPTYLQFKHRKIFLWKMLHCVLN